MGQTGGEETHALTDTEMPSHVHDIPNDNGTGSDRTLAGSNLTAWEGKYTSAAGSDTPHNNMPLFQVVNYIIKT